MAVNVTSICMVVTAVVVVGTLLVGTIVTGGKVGSAVEGVGVGTPVGIIEKGAAVILIMGPEVTLEGIKVIGEEVVFTFVGTTVVGITVTGALKYQNNS